MEFRRPFLSRGLILLLSILLTFLPSPVENVNVLIVDAVASPSHHIWMKALSYALGEHGYNVTVLSTGNPSDTPKNVHFLHIHEISKFMEQDMGFDMLESAKLGPFEQTVMFFPMYEAQDRVLLTSTAFQRLLDYPKDFKVDLFIFDYLSGYALLSLKDHFHNPPLIAVSPYPGIGMTNLMTKAPDFFSFVPHLLKYEVKNCFWDRLQNFLLHSLFNVLEQNFILPKSTKLAQKYVPQVKSISEIFLSSKLQMANYHPAIDSPQPIMPSVIPVGGLQIAKPKPLPSDLEEIYQRPGSKGTVLFSLGTNVKCELLGEERLEAIYSAFRQLPDYNFIWKIDATGLDLKLPPNVFIKTWLPQNDMLADNRTVLFISHAGGLSTQESTWFGVPMLAMPVMFDQFPNAEQVVRNGMGLKVDLRELKTDEFKSAIEELLTSKSYREKAQMMSRNFRDQPEPPMERALWWIDYVLRNPDVTFLQSEKLRELNYAYKHSVDVIAFLVLVSFVLIILILKVSCYLCCKNKKTSNPSKVKKQ